MSLRTRSNRRGQLNDVVVGPKEEKEHDSGSEASSEVASTFSTSTTCSIRTRSSTKEKEPRVAVRVKRKIVMKEMELTSSEDEIDDTSVGKRSKESSPEAEEISRAQSPTVPIGQYEIEDVVDYAKDEIGDMYLIKWKKWESHFNTWEPPGNLVNCDDALLNFYRKRKAAVEEILANSEYVEIAGGKRRRKGPPLEAVPPDPRPYEVRVQEFCDATEPITEEEIMNLYPEWNKKFVQAKGKDKGVRWPIVKVNRLLSDGVDGKLSTEDFNDLRKELIYIEMDRRKTIQSASLMEWQLKIKKMTQDKPNIVCENDVDFEGPPVGFEFVNDYIPSAGISIPSDPPVGCSCIASCYENRSVCCAKQFGSHFAYTKYRKVAVAVGTPIYECNRKCKCGPECPNRVVQDGKNDMKLSIFRTSNGCGWGVKTQKSIKRGCFVTLYVGEVIYSDQAEDRAKKDGNGHTYLFDLDFNDQENPMYSVDASKVGNVAHFINHSCNPNLGVYAVWIDCLDPNLPKLAMFAVRDIAKGEELSFDYTNQLSSDSNKTLPVDTPTKDGSPVKERKKCLCAAPKCRKYLF